SAPFDPIPLSSQAEPQGLTMAITTYAELKSAIGAWLGHELFADRYADFITLFEATACRRLKVRPMETVATLTPSSGAAALPSDYLGWRRATVRSTMAALDSIGHKSRPPSLRAAPLPVAPRAHPAPFHHRALGAQPPTERRTSERASLPPKPARHIGHAELAVHKPSGRLPVWLA